MAEADEKFAELATGVTLCYEEFGSPADPPLLLIMGLGTQMIAWPDYFCRELADRGFRVVRFDNRDIGRSTWMSGRPPGLARMALGRPVPGAYTLNDMADDAAALIEELDMAPAHVVGASMGGMLAQLVAIRRPDLVASLASIMSTTGGRFVGQPGPAVIRTLLRRPPRDREAIADHAVSVFRVLGSPPPHFDPDVVRETALRSFDRGLNPDGAGRQLGAIVSASNRTPMLKGLEVPTVVIHGTKDRLVPISGGRATAKAIPGAKLVELEGMGHDLPRHFWPEITKALAENATRANISVE